MSDVGNYSKYSEVPAELRERMRKFVEVRNAQSGRSLLRGYAENIEYPAPGVLKLLGTILDSSDRVNGITMREQWSFHEEFLCGGQIIWSATDLAQPQPAEQQQHTAAAAEVMV